MPYGDGSDALANSGEDITDLAISNILGLYLQDTVWNPPFNTYGMGDQAGSSA